MYELSQNLILNEDVLNTLSDKKRPVFIYQWLCFLNKVLIAAQKDDVQEYQSRIVEQLLQQIQNRPGPPLRILIGRNLATLFSICDPIQLFDTVNYCHGILKSKDQVAKLTTVIVIGALYECLGRFFDQSYEKTVHLLLETLKHDDDFQMRVEILRTFERIINGLGLAGRNIHREIFKIAKIYICDPVMSVRSATAMCLIALINHNNFMYTTELEGNITLGFRAFDGSNHQVRCSIAKYLAILLGASQEILSNINQSLTNQLDVNVDSIKKITAEDIFNYLAEGFLYGNISFSISDTTNRLLTTVPHEIRIGVTYTFVELVRIMGPSWIEQNLSFFINHILQLVRHPRVSTSHPDAAYCRKCITFILRSVIGSYLDEKAQFTAAKELTTIVTRYTMSQPIVTPSLILRNDSNILSSNLSTTSMIQSYGSSRTNHFELSDIDYHQHILICAINELSLLIGSFGTSTALLLQDDCHGLIDTLFLVILNPSHSVRLSAAWCFRSIGTALPSLMTSLIDKCFEKIHELAKQSTLYNTDTMFGVALALQALLGGVHQCPLGIPSQRGKTIFDFADDLLRTAIISTIDQQQSLIPRIILQRINTAWHLLSACCTLGQNYLKTYIPRLVRLWRNVFPRSQSDFEQEKQRGDLFTWILSFNQRSGALCSMLSFLNNCPTENEGLLTDDLFKRMLIPIENAIIILLHLPNLIKQFGHQLKASTTIFRLRLYEILLRIPIHFYEPNANVLLRELVAEFTLRNNSLNTATSLLRSIYHSNDNDLFDNWLSETDYPMTEEQFQSNTASDFGTLEHDETYLYRRDPTIIPLNIINRLYHSSLSPSNNSSHAYYSRSTQLNIPAPLSLGVTVMDASIQLYGTIFTRVSNKYRLDMFQHFIDIIKQSNGARQEAIQINILTAILISLKTLSVTKQPSPFNDDNLKKCICTIVMRPLNHSNSVLRCAASEALGRLTQIVNDGRFIADIAQFCFNHLKEFHDIQSRIGYALALGCLHRYVSNMNTGHYLNLSISILLTFAYDQSATIVQVSALHALTLIADSSGQMFRSYVERSLALILDLLFSILSSQIDIYRCCGRLLCALIIIIGPDLGTDTNYISIIRSLCLTIIHLLQMHIEPIIQAEAIQALQKLYLFAPRDINLSSLVPELIKGLKSRDLSLRRVCISCLRQLSQREATEVREHAQSFIHNTAQNLSLEFSVEELLFSVLDTEIDTDLCSNVQDALVCMLQTLGPSSSTHWLTLFKDVLNGTAETSDMVTSASKIECQATTVSKLPLKSKADPGGGKQLQIYRSTSSAKWQTQVFAINCIEKLINYCEQAPQSNLHFDYISANEHLRTYPERDHLVLHSNTLITFSYIACTSINDELCLSGLSLLKQIILKFAHMEGNVDVSGNILLAQVDVTLQRVFSQHTSSLVTALACDVCSIWIASSVAHDLNDFRRIYQLLVSLLQKLISTQQHKNDTSMIYSDIALTIENLAILKAWADVYNTAVVQQRYNQDCNLLILLQTELHVLIHHWVSALTDYAFLVLPNKFGSANGNFYSAESNIDLIRTIYKANWVSIIKATTQWLAEHNYELKKFTSYRQRDVVITKPLTSSLWNKIKPFPPKKGDIFAMLLGCCVEALSVSILEQTNETVEAVLSSLINLLQSDIATSQVTMNICNELINVLHRLSFVRTDIKTHSRVLNILENIFHLVSSCTRTSSLVSDDYLIPLDSFLFASLELLVSILLNYNPNITTDLPSDSRFQMKLTTKLCLDDLQIVELFASDVKLLCELITFRTSNETVQALIPIILHLLLSTSFVLLSTKSNEYKPLLSTIIQAIENMFSKCTNKKTSHRAMITIMNLRINLIEKDIFDNGYFVRCLTLLIINSNSIMPTKQVLNFYRKAFDDQESETHLQVFECINQLFQSKHLPLRNRFIQNLTPILLSELKKTNNQQQIIEILKIFETLLSVVHSTSRIHLASLIIPLFISFLPDSTSSDLEINVDLISHIIKRTQCLLSIYSNEFRLILQTLPDLQTKFENAIRQQQQHELH